MTTKKSGKAKAPWRESNIRDAVGTIWFDSWKSFQLYMAHDFVDYRAYIYRGQRHESWPLESTLDRVLRKRGLDHDPAVRQAHLDRFRFAARGRRGLNPRRDMSENDWWALGQHQGLLTPLLDWTASPFVAAYFAFVKDVKPNSRYRVVYALHEPFVRSASRKIKKSHPGGGRPPMVEVVRPLSDENPRLVSQAGLFTRSPDNVDVESWVRKQRRGYTEAYGFIKLKIPNRDREASLKALNRMNINHLTLFPDLHGASEYCNMDLQIDCYSCYYS